MLRVLLSWPAPAFSCCSSVEVIMAQLCSPYTVRRDHHCAFCVRTTLEGGRHTTCAVFAPPTKITLNHPHPTLPSHLHPYPFLGMQGAVRYRLRVQHHPLLCHSLYVTTVGIAARAVGRGVTVTGIGLTTAMFIRITPICVDADRNSHHKSAFVCMFALAVIKASGIDIIVGSLL
jgi:hypothetical protein